MPITGTPFVRKLDDGTWEVDEHALRREAAQSGSLAVLDAWLTAMGAPFSSGSTLAYLAHAGFQLVKFDPTPFTPAKQLEVGEVYQLGRKALSVEERDGELVMVLLAEAPASD